MKKVLLSMLLFLCLLCPRSAKADLFGGDVAVLTQILANALQQLIELKSILDSTKGNLDLMQDVYRGIHDAMDLIRTVSSLQDAGLYGDWRNPADAIRKLQTVYGIITPSLDAPIQKDADQSAAEAIALNNSIYTYTAQIDEIGEQIKSHSQVASPAGAQKITAQSMGVVLHVLNQGLRAQATALKLQAQALAIQNRKEKEASRNFLESSDALTKELRRKKTFFNYPRF